MGLGQRWSARYAFTIGAVATAFLLHRSIAHFVGNDVPPFITFYPTIMLVALMAGLGPGLAATSAAAILAAYFILPPPGFGIEHLGDAASLALFSGMGVFMSVVASLYRHSRNRLEEMVAGRTAALLRANEQLAREVEEHRRTEASLRENRAMLQSVVDGTSDAIFVKDRQGRYILFNSAAEAVTGKSRTEAIGRDDTFLFSPDEAGMVMECDRRVMADNRIQTFEDAITAATGEQRYFLTTKGPLHDANGAVTGLFGITHDITAIKRAEVTLRRAKDEWERTFDSVPDLITILDDQYRIIRANRAVAERLGVTPAECVGLICYENVHGTERPPASCPHTRTMADGREHATEVHEERLGGDFLVTTTPLLDESGRMTGTVHVARDISAWKRAEEALRESEARFSTVYHASPIGIGVSRLADEKFVDVNEAFLGIYGYTAEEVIGHSANELGLWLPEERERLVEELEKRGRVQNVEMAFRKKSGETGKQLVSVEMIELGGEKCILGLLIDITERKRAEEALLHSEHRFQTLAAATFEGIAISEKGRYIDANAQLARLLGYNLHELIGLEVAATLPPEDRDRILAKIVDGSEHTFDHEMVRKDGSRCFVEAHGQTIQQEGREIRLTAIHDITERRRYEEELIHARRAAEAASRAKSQFLANMSHELRTPMTGVLGMLELALEGELSPKQREYLATVQISATALLRLLNDILDFSRIEAGAITFAEEPFNLEWCVRSAVELFTLEAHRKGLELVVEVDQGAPGVVVGDEGRVRQVLVNLVGNAVKFTEQGKVTVRVTGGEKITSRRREITFAVSDTGIGIPADKMELVFKSFRQLDASTTRRHGGAGLGLAISRRIVEQMGGTIDCSSVEGRGSTFTFSIPLGEIGGAPPTDLPADPGTSAPSPAELGQVRLLVAEDDPVIRTLLETSLRNRGYELDIVGDGEEVVALWEKGEYSLVLMDVQMPRMDGFAAARLIRLKEREQGRHTPIMAITAHAFPEDEAKCRAAGMDANLAKPIDFRKLYRLLADLVGKRRQN